MEVSPALMPKTYEEIDRTVQKFSGSSLCVQLDLMDGVYVEAKTWPFLGDQYKNFKEIIERGLPSTDSISFELDLMVLDPMHDIETYLAMKPSRIVFHASSCDLEEVIEYKKNRGFSDVKIGIAFQITDTISEYKNFIQEFDYVQCMGIATIGKQGEIFDSRVLEQVASILQIDSQKEISIDGGVTPDVIAMLKERGIGRVVSGSFLLSAEDKREAIAQLGGVIY